MEIQSRHENMFMLGAKAGIFSAENQKGINAF